MELLYILLVLLVVSRALGEIAERLQQPALVGELCGGILVGFVAHQFPMLFGGFGELGDDEVFIAITDLGVFFLMLMAGIEMRPHALVRGAWGSLAVAIGGMVIPFGLGLLLGLAWIPESPYRLTQALFLGTALAITAVPVAVKILIDLGHLDSRVGNTIVAAALFDDILSLVLLAVLTSLMQTGQLLGLPEIAFLAGKILCFFAICTLVGIHLLPKLEPIAKRWLGDELEFTTLILVALSFAVVAELLHMHFIIGAFMAGLFFSRRSMAADTFEAVQSKISALTKGFLAPIFFASIGLHLDLSALIHLPVFVVLLTLTAIIGKMVGAGLPARLTGHSWRDSTSIGIGMSARGAVELIIAGIALRAGLFDQPDPPPPIIEHLFSAIVIMAIVTTLFTPIGLRLVMRKQVRAAASNEDDDDQEDEDHRDADTS